MVSISTVPVYSAARLCRNNFANFITASGLVATLLLAYRMAEGMRTPVELVIMGFIIATDWFDGFFARWLEISSWLGSVLDRLRDKVFVGALFYFMYLDVAHLSLPGSTEFLADIIIALLFLVATAEILLFFLGTYGIAKDLPIQPSVWGKRKMAIECVAIGSWSLIEFIPLGISLENFTVLATFVSLLAFALGLALKSIEGYVQKYREIRKARTELVIQNVDPLVRQQKEECDEIPRRSASMH